MLKNYLKMAIRNLLRSKYFSIINITGLAIGLAAIILIFLYVKFQLSFNNFHNDEDRLFRVSVKASHNGELESDSFIFTPPIGPAMKNDLPEVKIIPVTELHDLNILFMMTTRLKLKTLFMPIQLF